MTNDASTTTLLLQYLNWLCRAWGLLSALAVFAIGVELAFNGIGLGAYLIGIGVVVSLLELLYFIDKLLPPRWKRQATASQHVWNNVVSWLDNWKKGIIYSLLSIYCFMHPIMEDEAWIGMIAGVSLIISALLYTIKSASVRRSTEVRITGTDDAVAANGSGASSSSRFEGPDGVMGSGGSLVNEIPSPREEDAQSVVSDTAPLASATVYSVAEQDEIMES